MEGSRLDRALDKASFGIALWVGGLTFALLFWAAVGWALYELLRRVVA
jgi:hypothetical protein